MTWKSMTTIFAARNSSDTKLDIREIEQAYVSVSPHSPGAPFQDHPTERRKC